MIMNEHPPGVKANLSDSLRGIAPNRLAQGLAEKVRLYFLLALFHAVLQERLRYVPLAWSKTYDFNDSDMAAAFTTIDTGLPASRRVGRRSFVWENEVLSSANQGRVVYHVEKEKLL